MKKNYNGNWLFFLKSIAVFGSMLFAGAASAQLSGTYTINKGAAATGTNFQSFNKLADTLFSKGVTGPVTVNVVTGSGPYSSNVIFQPFVGASATNIVTINGNSNVITHAGTSAISPTIDLNGADRMVFDNLIIENTGSSNGRCVQLRNDADYNTVNNCRLNMPNMTSTSSANCYVIIGNGSGSSVFTYASAGAYNMISNNIMRGQISSSRGPYWGVFMADATGNSDAKPNTIHNNDISDFYLYGIRTYYCDEGTTITSNKIHNEDITSGSTTYGIYCYQYFAAGKFNISDNMIYSLRPNSTGTTYGIYYYGYFGTSTSKGYIRNNVVDLSGRGFTFGLYVYSPYDYGGIDILNNTISIIKQPGATSASTIYALYAGYTGGDVKNNIIYFDQNRSGGTLYGIYGFDNAGVSPISNFDNNNIHLDDITGSGNFYYAYYNANYNTYASLVSGFGTNWKSKSISFVDLAAQNYRLASFGLCNAGIPLATVPKDIYGATRHATTPDIGAAEFFLDLSVPTIAFTTNATECGNFKKAVGMTLKNESAFPLSNIPVAISVNGAVVAQEVVAGPIASGATATYTFTYIPTFNKPGSNAVKVSIDGVDDVVANNDKTYTFNIQSSPTGGMLTKGTRFDGYFNDGNLGKPDATVKTYISDYNITDPTTVTSFTTTIEAKTQGGTDVTALGFSLTGSDKIFTCDPAVSLAGNNIYLQVKMKDNTTLGCDTTFGRWMYVPHTPVPSFTSSNICLGDVAQFKNTSTLGGTSYISTNWEFNDPNPAVVNDVSDIKDGFWEYTTYGTGVNVKMTVSNGLFPKFKYSATKTINVTPKPEIDFKVLNACEGSPVTLINNTTISSGTPITYVWNFGGVYTSTDSVPSYTFTTPGQRKISVVATSVGCKAELTKNAYQFERPVASFTNVGKCNFVDVNFNSTSVIPNNGNMGYKWDFAGQGVSRSKSPNFAFATAGSKTVTLTATSEFGCEHSVTKTITLNESPQADFTFDRACNLTPISFTRTGSVPNGGQNSSYAWDFDGQSVSAQENPMYQFPKVGTKLVTLTINDLNGCSNAITKEVKVVLQSVADFTVQDVCQGSETVFTNKSTVAAGNLTYKWTFGDGSPVNSDHSAKHTYATATSYNVTLEAIVAGGCSDVITKPVFVNAAPDADFTVTKGGRTITLNSADVNDEYRWSFGNGGKAFTTDPTYTYDNVDKGTFTVCLATKKGICWSEVCKDVSINLAGITDLTERADMINVYPNPTSGKFNVTVDNAGKDVVVKVGDILGNVITAKVIDNLNGTYSVDMSAVADGVYFVQVKNGDYFATKRITVSK